MPTVLNSPTYPMGIEDKDKGTLRETAREFIKPNHRTAFEAGQKAEKVVKLAKKWLVKKKARIKCYRPEDQRQAINAVYRIKRVPK